MPLSRTGNREAYSPTAAADAVSLMLDDDAELYGDLEAPPQLPSAVELRSRLATALGQRKALEAQLETLQAEDRDAREAIKDLTRRACVLLSTARLELKRKEAALKELSVAVPVEEPRPAAPPRPPPPPPAPASSKRQRPAPHAASEREEAATAARSAAASSSST